MKSDLDRLMKDRGFGGIVVMGPAHENHILRYVTNGAKISEGTVVKKAGEPPALICGLMERDEAAKSGLPVSIYADYNLTDLMRQSSSPFEARLKMLGVILERHGVEGTVSFYGLGDPGQSYLMLQGLAELLPRLTITGETVTTIFDDAFMTKDDSEVTALTSVAERANTVFGEAVAFIKQHHAKDSTLVRADGQPLRIGDVKRFMRGRLIEYELEDPGGMIFAQGRDAGVPHSRGEDADALVLGKSIIFDFSPRDMATGFYHDMTRTLCLGFAPLEVQQAYDEVSHVFHDILESIASGDPYAGYQDRVCDFFEKNGHKTVRSDLGVKSGYVHGLGHGLGLEIHERPGMYSHSKDIVQPRQMVTIEPGLYYPERGFGVRVEDTVYIDEKGEVRSLTPYPKDLVIDVG